MKLHELAHIIAGEVQLIVRKEHRLIVLAYLASGFDENGDRIEHAEHQRDMLRAIDSDDNPA